ncbi:hypothetical protein E4U58_001108 [Claviceps cyperi]|nr:hypothetical protein E4U58_001108 [Claviceps cyperi]
MRNHASQIRKQVSLKASAAVFKRSKRGSSGRWKTPHHRDKIVEKVELGATFHVGDRGIWVTFARGMRDRALREFKALCEEYGETMYGIERTGDETERVHREENEDIEAAIEAELSSMKSHDKVKTRKIFTPVSVGVECLFFMKTLEPIEPGDLVRKMCEDAQACIDPRDRKCKYINRLTPVFDTEKATENGINRVAHTVLSSWFHLKGESDCNQDLKVTIPDESVQAHTYAIRYNIRNHTTFKSDEIIRKIADLIDCRHKVSLSDPDKVILVEIFQLFCGISVVDGKQWAALKRYNMSALYDLAIPEAQSFD